MNAGRSATSGPATRNRRGRAGLVVALSALVAAIGCALLVAFGAGAIVSRASCASHPDDITVAAAPDIAAAVTHVAAYFNARQVDISGHCAHVTVRAVEPAAEAAQLSGAPHSSSRAVNSGSRAVAAWIPDSSLWIGVARASRSGAGLVQPAGVSVARSPLMIAMPRSAAERVPAFGTSVGWQFLLPQSAGGPAAGLGVQVELPDPAHTSAGLATLIEMRQLLGSGASAATGFTNFLLSTTISPAARDAVAPLAALVTLAGPPRTGQPVTVASEQAIGRYDKAHPSQPLSARYPVQGAYELDYPCVVTTWDPLQRRAAILFERALGSAYARAYLSYEGFRSPGGSAPGWMSQFGLGIAHLRLAGAAPASQVDSALRAWAQTSAARSR